MDKKLLKQLDNKLISCDITKPLSGLSEVWMENLSVYAEQDPILSSNEYETIMKIIANTNDPIKRFKKSHEFIKDNLGIDDFATYFISNVLDGPNLLFESISFFNAIDYLTKKLEKEETKYVENLLKTHSIISDLWRLDSPELIIGFEYVDFYEDYYGLLINQGLIFYTSPEHMLYKHLDLLVRYFAEVANNNELDYDEILEKIVNKTGMRVFNVEAFRYFLNLESERSYFDSVSIPFYNFSHGLKHILQGKSSSKEVTDRQYWLYYALVQKLLREYGYKKIDMACLQASRLITGNEELFSTIRRRYFDKKKELEERFQSKGNKTKHKTLSFNIPDTSEYRSLNWVMNKYNLRIPIKNYLKKLESKKNE